MSLIHEGKEGLTATWLLLILFQLRELVFARLVKAYGSEQLRDPSVGESRP